MQQLYYKDCYLALTEYFLDANNMALLTTALTADEAVQEKPNPATNTAEVINQALSFGTYKDYVITDKAGDADGTAIATSVNNFAKDNIVTLVDEFNESQLNVIPYTSDTTAAGLADLIGTLPKIGSQYNFYLYFLLIQGYPIYLEDLLATLQSTEETTIGSVAYTNALIKSTQAEQTKRRTSSTSTALDSDSDSTWPIYTQVSLKDGKDFTTDFSNAVTALNIKLGTTTQDNTTTQANFAIFTATLATYNLGGTHDYSKDRTKEILETTLKTAMEAAKVNINFEAAAANPDYTYSDLVSDINNIVAATFAKTLISPDASDSFTDFQNKIINLELAISYDGDIRRYTANTSQMSTAEFNFTLKYLSDNDLGEVLSTLQEVVTEQEKEIELLKTDIKVANKRSTNMEGSLNGRIVINVPKFEDAEKLMNALVKNVFIQDNVYAIKFKYQQSGGTPPNIVEHNKIIIIYEQGVFTRLGLNLNYIDSTGQSLSSEIIETIQTSLVKTGQTLFPFFHKIVSAPSIGSGIGWGDELPITNKANSFIEERCTAIGQTLLDMNSQTGILTNVYKNDIIAMFVAEGQTASDPYFNANEIDAYLPYLRYSVK